MDKSTHMNGACYRCIYRGDLSGNAHSCCNHPLTEKIREQPLAQLGALMGGMPPIAIEGIEVRGHRHGIRMGWFAWPLNFDPNWLEQCSGFKAKAE